MNRFRVAAAILATMACMLPAPAAEPAGMDAAELVKLARVISLEDKEITSFHVSGVLEAGPMRLRFTVAGKQPDQIAFRLEDPRDGTPLLATAGEGAMIYDPLASEILLFDACTDFTLRMDPPGAGGKDKDPDAYTLAFGFFTHSPDSKEHKPTIIDIPSLLAAMVPPALVTADGTGSYVLDGKSKAGNSLTARIEPARAEGAFTRVALASKETSSDKLALTLDEIRINPTLPDSLFRLPEEDLKTSKLPVRRIENAGGLEEMVSMGKMLRAVMFRFALAGHADEKIRAKLEALAMKKLDWDAVERADREAGQVLKSIFKAQPAAPPP